MRDVKFRAWDQASGKWFDAEWWAISPDGTEITWSDMSSSYVRSTDDLILVQYTGLNDKNGVEIYEGDIVGQYAYWSSRESEIGRVMWDEAVTGFCVVGRGNHKDKIRECEVIGKIYENPELLGGE